MSADAAHLPALDFAWAGSTRVPAGSTYGPYTTAYCEFIWLMEGDAQVTSGAHTFELGPGSLQLTPMGVRNHYAWDRSASTSYGYAIFRVPEAHANEEPVEWPRFRGGRADDIIVPLLDHVLWLDTVQPPGWRASASTALAYAVSAFVTDTSATRLPADQPSPEPVANAVAFVRDRWENEGVSQPTLEEMAEAAGVTGEYLCRLFTRHVGMGPVTTLRTIRLHRAAGLLTSTNMSISEIAAHLGFSSEFHFSRSFRKLTGQPPSSFRQDPNARHELSVPLRQLSRQLPLG